MPVLSATPTAMGSLLSDLSTDEPFVYPILCVVMADGSVKELTVQTIMSGDRSFAYVDSPGDKTYSMNDDEI